MNLKEAKTRVTEIKNKKDDNEVAHQMEDKLYEDFIKYIAKGGTKDLKEIAVEILKTNKINFDRWYA